MKKIRLFDATLRDGSHAIGHQFTKKILKIIVKSLIKPEWMQ